MTKMKSYFSAKIILACFVMLAAILCNANMATAQIVALGASNVEGYGVSSSESFPSQIEAMLRARGKAYNVSNAGVYGDTTDGVLGRLDSAVPNGTRIVVLAVGGNDVRRGATVEQARAKVRMFEARLKARGIRVINAQPYVISALRSGMALPDRIHMTAEGHRWVAQKVVASIR